MQSSPQSTLKQFHHSKKKTSLLPISSHSLPPSPGVQSLAITHLLSVSVSSPIQDTSYKWNNTLL